MFGEKSLVPLSLPAWDRFMQRPHWFETEARGLKTIREFYEGTDASEAEHIIVPTGSK